MKTKRVPKFECLSLQCDGEEWLRLPVAIVPDTYNPEAPRWKRGVAVVMKRTQLARGFRRWRREGGRSTQGHPLGSMVGWLIREAAAGRFDEKLGTLSPSLP